MLRQKRFCAVGFLFLMIFIQGLRVCSTSAGASEREMNFSGRFGNTTGHGAMFSVFFNRPVGKPVSKINETPSFNLFLFRY